jgi:predicted ATPase
MSGIEAITISGYKSLASEQSIEIRPLTLLAGANSSGKSSVMQPLLLLKQTLEASYDPGPLLLNGPNVKLTSGQQIFSRTSAKSAVDRFSVVVTDSDQDDNTTFALAFEKNSHGLRLATMGVEDQLGIHTLHADMTGATVREIAPPTLYSIEAMIEQTEKSAVVWEVVRYRCFLSVGLRSTASTAPPRLIGYPFTDQLAVDLQGIIHVPGLRGNPERAYKTSAVGEDFPGTFENYVASVIDQWQRTTDHRLRELSSLLMLLGLTNSLEAKRLDDTQVELHVGRVLRSGRSSTQDTVNIADVGFGVSQTLPVLVALLVARPGQLVYIEQPELHLHPKAQTALAPILTAAAERGVKVVVETHSALLLRAIQTLVAKGELAPDRVKLHWFQRDADGMTEITSADLDEDGAFGQWPEDFDDVMLNTEAAYLDAVTLKS